MEVVWTSYLVLCSALYLDLLCLQRAKDAPFSPAALRLIARTISRDESRAEKGACLRRLGTNLRCG